MRIVNQPHKKTNYNETESTNETDLTPSKVERVHSSEKKNRISIFQSIEEVKE